MRSGIFIRLICVVAAALLTASAQAALRLPAVFSDHMVLQALRAVPCWGWSEPGEEVGLVFEDMSNQRHFETKAVADSSGRWRALLPALPDGSHGTLKIKAGGEERVIADVVVGEVWLASGQSNMSYRVGAPDFPANVAALARKEASAVAGEIHLFAVIQEGADEPRGDVRGKWIVVDQDNVENCSALPWNFSLALHRELKGPVGVIVSAHGGTPVESWLSRETLDATPVAADVWKRHADLVARSPEAKKAYDIALANWTRAFPTPEAQKKNQDTKPRGPYSETSAKAPVRLFNAMIAGLAPYAIQGVIWYQGEENSGRPQEYAPLIRALVTSWRKLWGVEWPFYYVELANTRDVQTKPSEGGWALIREAQASVLALPRTDVVTAVDLGNGKIHPWNKKAVGQRLASLVLADVHGRMTEEVRSPAYVSHEIVGDVVRVRVSHAKQLRVRGDGIAQGFAIAGADGRWVWAKARVTGDVIEVSSPEVSAPVAVRYGWSSNPLLSVENEAGLPLRPFRTDRETP